MKTVAIIGEFNANKHFGYCTRVAKQDSALRHESWVFSFPPGKEEILMVGFENWRDWFKALLRGMRSDTIFIAGRYSEHEPHILPDIIRAAHSVGCQRILRVFPDVYEKRIGTHNLSIFTQASMLEYMILSEDEIRFQDSTLFAPTNNSESQVLRINRRFNGRGEVNFVIAAILRDGLPRIEGTAWLTIATQIVSGHFGVQVSWESGPDNVSDIVGSAVYLSDLSSEKEASPWFEQSTYSSWFEGSVYLSKEKPKIQKEISGIFLPPNSSTYPFPEYIRFEGRDMEGKITGIRITGDFPFVQANISLLCETPIFAGERISGMSGSEGSFPGLVVL